MYSLQAERTIELLTQELKSKQVDLLRAERKHNPRLLNRISDSVAHGGRRIN
jgi:hypothetical protein